MGEQSICWLRRRVLSAVAVSKQKSTTRRLKPTKEPTEIPLDQCVVRIYQISHAVLRVVRCLHFIRHIRSDLKSDSTDFQIYHTDLKPAGSGFACRRCARLRPVWIMNMCPRPALEVLTCVVVVAAAVLVAIHRCGSSVLSLPR